MAQGIIDHAERAGTLVSEALHSAGNIPLPTWQEAEAHVPESERKDVVPAVSRIALLRVFHIWICMARANILKLKHATVVISSIAREFTDHPSVHGAIARNKRFSEARRDMARIVDAVKQEIRVAEQMRRAYPETVEESHTEVNALLSEFAAAQAEMGQVAIKALELIREIAERLENIRLVHGPKLMEVLDDLRRLSGDAGEAR
jgi:hypothetical protein